MGLPSTRMRACRVTGFKPGDRVQHHTGVEGTVTRCNGKFATVDWDHYVRANIHHVDLLTPLGEPMSKRTDFLDADGSPMTIEGQADNENWAIKFASTYREFTPADAPALALAILEAAGVEPLSEHYGANNDPSAALSHASHFLAKHAELTQAAAKEAADREALEKRRDALAIQFGSSNLGYKDTFESTQRAIDRVIELEDQASRESHGVTA